MENFIFTFSVLFFGLLSCLPFLIFFHYSGNRFLPQHQEYFVLSVNLSIVVLGLALSSSLLGLFLQYALLGKEIFVSSTSIRPMFLILLFCFLFILPTQVLWIKKFQKKITVTILIGLLWMIVLGFARMSSPVYMGWDEIIIRIVLFWFFLLIIYLLLLGITQYVNQKLKIEG